MVSIIMLYKTKHHDILWPQSTLLTGTPMLVSTPAWILWHQWHFRNVMHCHTLAKHSGILNALHATLSCWSPTSQTPTQRTLDWCQLCVITYGIFELCLATFQHMAFVSHDSCLYTMSCSGMLLTWTKMAKCQADLCHNQNSKFTGIYRPTQSL